MTQAAVTTETKKRTRAPANPNDPSVKFNKASAALRSLERRQRAAFENFTASWKAKRGALLADIEGGVFEALKLCGVCNSHDAKVREQAIADKALQDEHGLEPDTDDSVDDTDADR